MQHNVKGIHNISAESGPGNGNMADPLSTRATEFEGNPSSSDGYKTEPEPASLQPDSAGSSSLNGVSTKDLNPSFTTTETVFATDLVQTATQEGQEAPEGQSSFHPVPTRFDWSAPKSCAEVVADILLILDNESDHTEATVNDGVNNIETEPRMVGCAQMLVNEEEAVFHLAKLHKHLAGHIIVRDRTCSHPACVLQARTGLARKYNMYTLELHRSKVHSKFSTAGEADASERMRQNVTARMESLFGPMLTAPATDAPITAREQYLKSLFEREEQVTAAASNGA